MENVVGGFRQVSLVSTTRRAKLVLLTIALVGFSLGSYPLWTVEVSKNDDGHLKCQIKDHKGAGKAVYKRWNTTVLMFGTLLLPGTVIAIITAIIIAILSRAVRRRESMQVDRQVTGVFTCIMLIGWLRFNQSLK